MGCARCCEVLVGEVWVHVVESQKRPGWCVGGGVGENVVLGASGHCGSGVDILFCDQLGVFGDISECGGIGYDLSVSLDGERCGEGESGGDVVDIEGGECVSCAEGSCKRVLVVLSADLEFGLVAVDDLVGG